MSLAAVCTLTGILLYVNTIGHDYALDDIAVIQQNKFTQQGFAGIPKMLTTFYWEGYWNNNAGLYRPLSLITFAIEHQFFPNVPQISHAINVLLYAFIGWLLFQFLALMLGDKKLLVSFIATMLFIMHPLHTEVVANIKSRDELLAFAFFLCSAMLWWKWLDTGKIGQLTGALICFFLSLFSKEGAIVFVPIFPLLTYYFKRESLGFSLKKSAILLVPAVIFLFIHSAVIYGSSHQKITYSYLDNALVAAPNAADQLATALSTTTHYFKMLIWPWPMSYDYSFNQVPIVGFANGNTLMAIALILTMAFFAVKQFEKRTLISFGILFFGITFSLTSNLIMLIGATMADRFLFVPLLGFTIIVAHLMDRFLLKEIPVSSSAALFSSGVKPLVILIILAIPMSAATIARNRDWKDNFTLFSADVNASPNSARTHYNYGTAYMDRIAFKAKDAQVKVNEFKKVAAEFERAVEIDPKAIEATHNLGIAYYYAQEYEDCVKASTRAFELNPSDGTNLIFVGNAWFRLNDYKKAMEAFEKGLSMNAKTDDTYNFMGTASFNLQRYDDAVKYYKLALESDPKQTEVMNNLASVFGTIGQYQEAIDLLLKSNELKPGNGNTCFFLAITYMRLNDQENAEIWAQKARDLGVQI